MRSWSSLCRSVHSLRKATNFANLSTDENLSMQWCRHLTHFFPRAALTKVWPDNLCLKDLADSSLAFAVRFLRHFSGERSGASQSLSESLSSMTGRKEAGSSGSLSVKVSTLGKESDGKDSIKGQIWKMRSVLSILFTTKMKALCFQCLARGQYYFHGQAMTCIWLKPDLNFKWTKIAKYFGLCSFGIPVRNNHYARRIRTQKLQRTRRVQRQNTSWRSMRWQKHSSAPPTTSMMDIETKRW